MKFILEGGKMVAADFGGYLGGKPEPGSIMEKINNFSDSIVNKEMEIIFRPIGEFAVHCMGAFGDWFITYLPDIMGYSTMATGAFVIIGALTGRGVTKPLGWLTAGLITAICILGGV